MVVKNLIIYGSEYGTAKCYAEKLSELTEIPALSFENADSPADCDLVVYFGGLYAGGVKGLNKTVKNLGEDTRLIIVTVGLAGVTDQENIDNIRKSLKSRLPEQIMSKAAIFHLRGGIDYEKLNFAHKTMMKLLVNKVKNIPEDKRNSEQNSIIETYGGKVNFVDFEALKPIIEEINR